MTGRWYEFIVVGYDIDYTIYLVFASNLKEAILKVCDYFGVSKLHRRAIHSCDADDAIALANEWLPNEIVNIHELGVVFYNSADNNIVEIK